MQLHSAEVTGVSFQINGNIQQKINKNWNIQKYKCSLGLDNILIFLIKIKLQF